MKQHMLTHKIRDMPQNLSETDSPKYPQSNESTHSMTLRHPDSKQRYCQPSPFENHSSDNEETRTTSDSDTPPTQIKHSIQSSK